MEELISTSQLDVVGRLAFKYMEMCKVDSSSDSESEMSTRWSDVNKTCDSGAPQNPDAQKKVQRFRQTYQQRLDPYDGSSEDSGSSAKGSRKQRQAGARLKATGRRSSADVQMRSSSDSETAGQAIRSPPQSSSCAAVDLCDSGFNTRSSVSSPAAPSCRDAGSPDGPAALGAFSKRKFFLPSGEVDDGMRRKRQCISDMEAESAAF